MKNQIKFITLIFAAIFFIFSCEKDNSTPTTSNVKKQSALTDLFKNIAPPIQNFTITAGQYQVVTGEKGTKIAFFNNSFKKKDGTILTSGSVKIVLQEMLTGSEMILANKTTTSNGQLLQSGGQILVKAYLNGEELLVNKNAKPEVLIPSNTLRTMSLYAGTIKENDSIKGDTSINWDITKDTVKVKDTQAFVGGTFWPRGYGFFMDSFRYWNCDQLWDAPSGRTELNITLPTGFVDSNSSVFIYFTSINSVAKCEGFIKSTNTFHLNHSTAPIGMSIKILAIGHKNGKYYYEIKSAMVTDGYSTTMSPIEVTEADLKLAIKSL